MKQISKYQRESFHRKLTSILVIAVLVAVVFAVGFVVKLLDFTLPVVHRSGANYISQSSKNITISGNMICLSLKGGQVDSSNKCKPGIINSEGKKYSIAGGNNFNLYGETNSNGIEVSGEFIPAGEEETYDIVGTIKRS